jgi:hypothetical protein
MKNERPGFGFGIRGFLRDKSEPSSFLVDLGGGLEEGAISGSDEAHGTGGALDVVSLLSVRQIHFRRPRWERWIFSGGWPELFETKCHPGIERTFRASGWGKKERVW